MNRSITVWDTAVDLVLAALKFDIVTTLRVLFHDGTLLHSRSQYTIVKHSRQLLYNSNTRITSTSSQTQQLITTPRTHVQPLRPFPSRSRTQLTC
jgi:hypothetical protein